MNNKKVQEKFCTEPKEPEQALEFAIAFVEGVKRQNAYESHSGETPKSNIKREPVFAVEKSNPRECFRYGDPNITMEHVKLCQAANYCCKFCKIVGHTEKCCNKNHPHRQKEMVQRLKSRNEQGMRRVNYIEETEDEESDVDEEQLVLKIEGKGSKPFYMEVLMCGNHFKAIIDTGSPVFIFTEKDLQKIVGERKVVIREVIEKERFVDYNKKRGLPIRAISCGRSNRVQGERLSGAKLRKVNSRPRLASCSPLQN